MANNLGSLVVSLGLDAAEFVKGLSKSQYQAEQFARKVESGIEFARNSFVTFSGAAVAALAIVDRQAENISAFQELADKIGDSAEAVASLKLASDISGVALDTVAAASVKLTSALSMTDDESKGVGRALSALGLNLREFRSVTPVEQLEKIAKAFQGFEDGAGKTSVAVKLFGRAGADLIPLLNDLGDGAERQVSLTGKQIKAADDYAKQTARLRSELDTLVKTTAADAIPTLSAMATMLQSVLRYSTSSADGVNVLSLALGGARTVMETLVVTGADVAFVFKSVGDTIGAYIAVAERLVNFDVAGAKAIGEAYRANSKDRRQALDEFQQQILLAGKLDAFKMTPEELQKRGLGPRPRLPLRDDPDPKDSKPRRDSGSFLDYQQQVTQRVGSLLEGSDVIQAKTYADTLKQLDDLYFAGALKADLYESAVRKLTGSTSSAKDLTSQFAEEQKRLADLLGATASAGLARQQADIELLQKALAAGTIDIEKYADAVRSNFGGVADQIKEAKSFADELGLSFSSAFEDAVVGGGKFSDVLKGLGDDIVRLIVRSQVTKPLADAIGGFDFGGLFSGIFGGARASGGPVSGGKTYLVGERGPELFTPSNAGRITPNGALGGGSLTVRVVNESGNPVQASSASQSTAPDGSALIEIVLAAAGEAVANRSGPLSRGLEAGYGLRPSMG